MTTITDEAIAPAWMPAVQWEDEAARLAALHDTGLTQTTAHQRFDALTGLARDTFGVATALVTLVDRERHLILSRAGQHYEAGSRNDAICAYALHEPEMLVVEDLRDDAMFAGHPSVVGAAQLRFYAGAVLRACGGEPLGTLCLLDALPRRFNAHDRRTLAGIARLVENEIQLPAEVSAQRALAQVSAQRDPITGLIFGDLFFDQLDALRESRFPDVEESALMVSAHIDNLEGIAATHGSLVANEVAIGISQRLNQALGGYDQRLMARLANDWFAAHVVTPSAGPVGESLSLLRRALVRAMQKPISTAVGRLRARVAIGIANMACDQGPVRRELNLCRIAAGQQTESGDVSAVIVDRRLREAEARRQRISADLPDAIRRDELSLSYQPKFDATSQRLVGVECLLRWAHPRLGDVSPLDVVEVAARTGYAARLDRWVLGKAMERARAWQFNGFEFGRLSVNIMASTLVDPSFESWFRNRLVRAAIDGSRLDLEIVESSVISDFNATVSVMTNLRDLGITFSLDDFGTGFSSLAHLRELPASNLKIDKSFVDQLSDDERSTALCSGIVNLAHELGMRTVAEGVETASQSGILKALNCDELQGYYFAKPLSAAELEARFGVAVTA